MMNEDRKIISISKARKKELTLDEIKAKAGLIYKNGKLNSENEPLDMRSGQMITNKTDGKIEDEIDEE